MTWSGLSTNIGKSGFFYRGVVIWNNLPSVLYGIKELLNFKSTYKKLCSQLFVCKVAKRFCFVLSVCACVCICCLVFVICSHIVCYLLGTAENQLVG